MDRLTVAAVVVNYDGVIESAAVKDVAEVDDNSGAAVGASLVACDAALVLAGAVAFVD